MGLYRDFYEPDPEDFDEPVPFTTTCERCGEAGLSWGNDGRGWYLIDSAGWAHKCDHSKHAATDFAVTA